MPSKPFEYFRDFVRDSVHAPRRTCTSASPAFLLVPDSTALDSPIFFDNRITIPLLKTRLLLATFRWCLVCVLSASHLRRPGSILRERFCHPGSYLLCQPNQVRFHTAGIANSPLASVLRRLLGGGLGSHPHGSKFRNRVRRLMQNIRCNTHGNKSCFAVRTVQGRGHLLSGSWCVGLI